MHRGDEKKQAILDVAERLFYLKGYEQTSVQDILDVLKASKGSFYHHFESKYTVLDTLCTQRAEKALMQAEEAVGRETDSLIRLNLLLHYALPIRQGEEQFLSLLLPMAFSHGGEALYTRYADALGEAFSPRLKETLARAREEKVIYLYYPHQTEDMLMALVNRCWRSIAGHIMGLCYANGAPEPAALMEILQAYRFAMERVLDAPYGSLELVRLPELTELAQRVLAELRLKR